MLHIVAPAMADRQRPSEVCDNTPVKVLHINDVARIGTQLVREANRRGLPWDLLDTARQDPRWSGRTRALRRALRGLAWEGQLALRLRGVDLVNLHGGNIRRHTAWVRKPYVLHLHGSDVRTTRLQPNQQQVIDTAIAKAEQVYYTTPDLIDNVTPLRSDATLQPVVVDVAEVPLVTQLPERPRVIFPSRWDAAKGGDLQIETAVALRAKLGRDVIFEGLNWGENAGRAAREAGVVLQPKMSHEDYASWIACGTVAVGQMTGMMGVSELEMIATGIPLALPLNPRWYDGGHPTTRDVPVIGGPVDPTDRVDAVVEAVAAQIADPQLTDGRQWVETWHSPKVAVDRLLDSYSKLSVGA